MLEQVSGCDVQTDNKAVGGNAWGDDYKFPVVFKGHNWPSCALTLETNSFAGDGRPFDQIHYLVPSYITFG